MALSKDFKKSLLGRGRLFALIGEGKSEELDAFLTETPDAVKWKDNIQRPVLMVAKKQEIIDVLFKHKADPNAENTFGLTPVMSMLMERKNKGVTEENTKALEKLIAIGADPHRKSKKGADAFKLAKEYGDTQAIGIFEASGAKAPQPSPTI